jgi:hypothetical protein
MSSLERCRSSKQAALKEPSAWGLYWPYPEPEDSQNRVQLHWLQAEFGSVTSRGESACVYPPQPLKKSNKTWKSINKASSQNGTWLESR